MSMNKVLNNIDIHVAFTPSGNHNENLVSKESLHESLGKIAKWKTDFHSVVWDGNASLINGHTVATNVPADAKFTDTVYELPPATTETLGGIIVGNNLSIDEDGVLSAEDSGVTDVGYVSQGVISVTKDGMTTQIDLTQQLRSQVAALEELVASLQSELAELKTQVVYSDDVHYIKKISPVDYASSVHSEDVMYLLNDEFTTTEEGD